MKYFTNYYAYFLLFSALFFGYGCDQNQENKDISINIPLEINNIEIDTSSSAFSSSIRQYSKSIPSPVELTTFIKESGVQYNKTILHDPLYKDNYLSNLKQALNLGVYGADITYLAIHKKSREITPYFEAVRNLMQDLEIHKKIDFERYRKMAESPTDSLINVFSRDFDKINDYLMERKRGGVSWLILMGGWIEGLYFVTSENINALNATQKTVIEEKILEQKIVLEDLLFMLDTYKNDDGFDELNSKLIDLKKSFDKVQVSYTDNPTSTTVEKDDFLVVEDQNNSNVVLDEALFTEIAGKVNSIRTFIVEN